MPRQRVTPTDKQEEILRLAFAETGNMSHAAREAGLAVSTARNIMLSRYDEFAALRKEKRIDLIEQMHVVRRILLEEIVDPARLKVTPLKDIATAYGIITEKQQLLSGGPTATIAVQRMDPSALTPEERETARQFRERMIAARAAQPVEVVDVDSKIVEAAAAMDGAAE